MQTPGKGNAVQMSRVPREDRTAGMPGVLQQLSRCKAHSRHAAKKFLLLRREGAVGLLGDGGYSFPKMLGGMTVGDTGWGGLSALETIRTSQRG